MSNTLTSKPLKCYQRQEQVRLQAAPLFAQGLPNAEVARRLHVSRKSASLWFSRWQAHGEEGLKGGKPGPAPRLDEAQRHQLAQALWLGQKPRD